MTAKTLHEYKVKLDASFVMKDLHKYRNMPQVMHESPQFFTTYPALLNQAAKTMFTVDGVSKVAKERAIFGSFKAARRWRGLVGDAFKLWRAFR
jgi:electron transfer flavoprotein-quinone oxidoreductase